MSTELRVAELPSRVLLEGYARAPARAMLRAVGLTDEDFTRPLIGVANTWSETTPCNAHLRELAMHVKQGVREAGGTPLEFNTTVVSDGITMGTEGMKASLVSREVIADSIELTARAYHFDGIIALSGCDKTIPAGVMALARLNVPGLVLYGGSIAPGKWNGRDVTIQDVYEAIGEAHADTWPPPPPDEVADGIAEIEASGLFDEIRVRRYVWETMYTADEYIALLKTFSGHIAMDAPKREHLYCEIRARIARRPDRRVQRHWFAILHVATARRSRRNTRKV
jgi:hypothetical protein